SLALEALGEKDIGGKVTVPKKHVRLARPIAPAGRGIGRADHYVGDAVRVNVPGWGDCISEAIALKIPFVKGVNPGAEALGNVVEVDPGRKISAPVKNPCHAELRGSAGKREAPVCRADNDIIKAIPVKIANPSGLIRYSEAKVLLVSRAVEGHYA